MSSTRKLWLDLAKGISFLLVIVGHTLSNSVPGVQQWLWIWIYSFHMPLFFFLGGVTFRPSASWVQWRSKVILSFRALILPALAIHLLRLTIPLVKGLVQMVLSGELGQVADILVDGGLAMLFASGVPVTVFGLPIPAAGMIWFLVVLFWVRIIWDALLFLGDRAAVVIGVCLSFLGWYLSQLALPLPLSLDIALTILPIFYLGYRWESSLLQDQAVLGGGLGFSIWMGIFAYLYLVPGTYLELASRAYPLYPLSLLMAAAASCFWAVVSQKLGQLKPEKGMRSLAIIGQHTMILFWIHAFDYLLKPLWSLGPIWPVDLLLRLLLNLGVLGLYLLWKEKNTQHH